MLERLDKFLGYYDYDQNVLRLGITFRPSSRLRVSVAALSRTYDYARAFAFSDPAGGPMELDDVGGEVILEYRMTPRLALRAELSTSDITSSDPRAGYTRTQSMLGVKWVQ